jgi:hypothetical protein
MRAAAKPVPPQLEGLMEDSMPIYERLAAYRLRPVASPA